MREGAFHAGHEAEEVRAIWHAAHQNVLLDEGWLWRLLAESFPPRLTCPVEQARVAEAISTPPVGRRQLVDWDDAPDVPSFYGREREVTTLAEWVVQARCRVVSVLGLGGMGKSALATRVMHQVAPHFEVVLWRSLRDAPTCEMLLDDCLRVLAPEVIRDVSVNLERRLALLLEHLRRMHVLLVFDNLETLLEEGIYAGSMRAGFEGYARLLHLMAETEHQSCLLLTSREKPSDLVPLEGNRGPIRALRLARLDADACQQLLAEREIEGSAADQAQLIEAYAGNPLALIIIAQTIVDLFAGEIAPFLEQGEVVFGGVRKLFDEQYARLADLEQKVLFRLAFAREPVTLSELRAFLVMPRPSGKLLEAVDRLRQRCLIEHGQRPGSFTLQSVVLEYVRMRFGSEPRDQAVTACAPDQAWTFPDSRQGVYTADIGAGAGSFASIFSEYAPVAYTGGRTVALAPRPIA
jgi:hypothetical protein